MMSSPVGLLFVARTARGLRYVEYMDRKSLKRMIASHAAAHPDATWEPSLLELKAYVEQIEMYFNGSLHEFQGALDPIGTEFQAKVWKELSKIPFGQTRTYGQIAAALGQPKARRAIGLANNQNPIAIVVPCHRVIGADGSMTGYGGGVPRKKWLLEHETQHKLKTGGPGDLFASAGRETGPRAKR
jgi:O-6-methylguanine DNA methyltransferase